MALATPITFLIFNRPDLTDRVFAVIAAAAPAKLYLVADGPRFPAEAAYCQASRAIVNRINWDCEVHCNFADENMGCRKRIVSGLNWVFSNELEAIILEDDCVPHPSFFSYCETLLKYYRNNEGIMEVGGCNYQLGHSRTDYSYYFSKYSHTNGWATWRRAWQYFDEYIEFWPKLSQSDQWSLICEQHAERQYWKAIYDNIFTGQLTSAWDYQWQLVRWYHRGLSVVPNLNLVSNIGFGPGATHTRRRWNQFARLPTSNIGSISHPPIIIRNEQADQYMFRKLHRGNIFKRAIRKARGMWRSRRAYKN